MTEMKTAPTATEPLGRYLAAGALGGIAGGLVFGMMMWQMGMLTMIAGMLGSGSAWVGFGIHMMISIAFGLIGGFALQYMPAKLVPAILYAIAFGVVLWVAGPLVGMPIMAGGTPFTINFMVMMSLVGHIIYGLITMFAARALLTKRA